MRLGSNPIADMSGWESQCKEKKVCSVAWGGFKIHASADGRSPIADTCGWRHTERKEPKEHVVCLSVTPFGWRHTERKETKGTRGLPERHAFWLETHRKGRKRKERVVCLSVTPFLEAAPHSKLHRSPSVTRNASVISNGYLSAAVSLPEWLRG